MDEEILRREITAQVQAEFETQLREMRRQKNAAEEELENASERWRTERRRLNSEIDRLEDTLLAAKRPSAEPSREAQQAMEEKLKAASAEWELERERWKAQCARLETSLAEALARSSNPLRTTQAIKDAYEVKLAESNRLHLESEREFLRIKATWEEEKKKLFGELIRLRRLAPPAAFQVKDMAERLGGRDESAEEARIRELETQLSQARDTILKSHETAIRTSAELADARREVEALNRTLANMKEHVGSGSVDQLRRDYDVKIQNLVQEKTELARRLETVARTGESAEMAAFSPPEVRLTEDVDVAPIAEEIQRVEQAIAVIERLLDDPDTSASTIAQKNSERAEIEAYLRGLHFQIARGKAQ